MIILIIADDTALKAKFSSFFAPLGYAVIQYTHPLKAMDNLGEIHPDVILCNSSDYPRHWKLIVKEIRDSRGRNDAVVVLTVAKDFDSEEADKAAFLGVNILHSESLDTAENLRALECRISRYKTPPERSRVFSWVPEDKDRVSFMFRHPNDFRMISGRFTELSPAGGIFRPDDPSDLAELETGDIIENGSMKAGQSILSLRARIIRNSGLLSLAFIDFTEDGFECLLEEMNLHAATI